MGEWIADCGEAAFEELGEAFVLGLFGIGFEEVEGEDGIVDGENFVHESGTVAFDAREIADALGEAFGGFEEGLDEVDDAVGAAVLPLAVGENPVETPPFRGLAGAIFQTPVAKGAGDLVTSPTFSEQP